MARRILRFVVPAASAVLAAVAFSACSNSSSGTPPETGGAAGMGGTPATGGVATGGGGTATGGGGAATGGGGAATGGAATGGTGGKMEVDAGSDYKCEANLPSINPGGTGTENSACCGGLGLCVKSMSVSSVAGSASFGHDSCSKSADLVCAPAPAGDAATTQAENAGLYAVCHTKLVGPDVAASDAGTGLPSYEGRCIPKCFTAGNPNASELQHEDCGGADGGGPLDLVCSPCYNPVDGTPTGACSQKPGDSPKEAKPDAYKTCGVYKVDGGDDTPQGICVPQPLVLASGNPAAPNLKPHPDECPPNNFCVPTLKANNLNACFEKCSTGKGSTYDPGACVPAFVVADVNPGALALFPAGAPCSADFVCAPCVDPLMAHGHYSASCE